MNKVFLIGRLTRDVELRATQSNLSVAQFSIAVNRPYNPESSERQADFINCVVWRRQAENLSKYCHRGSQIAVEGRIQTRKYVDRDNKTIYVTEVLCENITFLDTRSKAEDSQNGTENIEETQIYDSQDSFKEFSEEVVINENDLPF